MGKSITEEIMGSSAQIKVVDYILEGRELDYSMSNIAEGSGITRQHAYRIMKALAKHNVVKKTRVMSGIQLYQINKESPIARGLMAFQDVLLKYQVARIEREGC